MRTTKNNSKRLPTIYLRFDEIWQNSLMIWNMYSKLQSRDCTTHHWTCVTSSCFSRVRYSTDSLIFFVSLAWRSAFTKTWPSNWDFDKIYTIINFKIKMARKHKTEDISKYQNMSRLSKSGELCLKNKPKICDPNLADC